MSAADNPVTPGDIASIRVSIDIATTQLEQRRIDLTDALKSISTEDTSANRCLELYMKAKEGLKVIELRLTQAIGTNQ